MIPKVSIVKLALTVSVTLLTALSGAPAVAKDGVIRFGLTGDYPPFAEKHEDGRLTGADVETARAMARSVGKRAEFVITTWTSLSTDFADRKFDVAIGGLTITPERAALGTFSVRLLNDGKRPLALCTKRTLYGSLAQIDRPGVRVQINRGREIGALALQWLKHASIVRNVDDSTLTSQLLEGKVDVWITDGVVVDRMARRSAGRLCSTMAKPLNRVEKAWLIQNNAGLIRLVNKALRKALRDGSWGAALQAN